VINIIHSKEGEKKIKEHTDLIKKYRMHGQLCSPHNIKVMGYRMNTGVHKIVKRQ
jgi:hypothetical protein